MMGAIIGDIVGSVYEWQNHHSKEFPLFHPNASFTDDSLCTIAVADCLLSGGDPTERLLFWGRRYPDSRRHQGGTRDHGYDLAGVRGNQPGTHPQPYLSHLWL